MYISRTINSDKFNLSTVPHKKQGKSTTNVWRLAALRMWPLWKSRLNIINQKSNI